MNRYNLPKVIGCPLYNEVEDTSQPVKVVLETNRMDQHHEPVRTTSEVEAVAALLTAGLVYIMTETALLVRIAQELQEIGRKVVCIISDPWPTFCASLKSGLTQPLNFVCGCETPLSNIMGYLQQKQNGIVILDVNQLATRNKADVTAFRANFQKILALGKKANTVFLVEEDALKKGPADLFEAAINAMPELAKVSSVA